MKIFIENDYNLSFDIYNYDEAKKHLEFRLTNTDNNRDSFDDVGIIYLLYGSGDLLCYIALVDELDNGYQCSIKLTKGLMDKWSKPLSIIVKDAISNFNKEETVILHYDCFMFDIITNKSQLYGATRIFDRNSLRNAMGDTNKVYLLPSSVHEWLLIDVNKANCSSKDIRSIVEETNNIPSVIQPNEVLSNKLYLYDKNTDEFYQHFYKEDFVKVNMATISI